MDAPVGLIAGLGQFPFDVSRAARARGQRVVAVGFRDITDPALAEDVDRFEWLYLGELEKLLAFLAEQGARDVVMAGKIPKTLLFSQPGSVRPDARALAALAALKDRKDDSLLGAVAAVIESEGHRLLGQAELTPELFVPAGPLTARAPSDEEWRDIVFGWPVARTLGGLDIGQTVVVKGAAVLALEAVEGTDEAIRRGCALGEKGACVIKVAKPSQDPRFDVPAIGPDTIATLVEGGAAVLAVEADKTVAFGREELLREADAHDLCVVGVTEADVARRSEGA